MEFPIEINVSLKRKNLKAGELAKTAALELAYNQLFDKLRKLNIIKVDENEYEITAKAKITISAPLLVKGS